MACQLPSEVRRDKGFGENFLKSIRKNITEAKVSLDELRSLVKNVGIDDPRALELRSGKEHIFGKNLKEIEEWNPSKGDIPKDVLVKMRDKDGNIEHFISERKTDMKPSKFIIQDNGRVAKNPDWTYVGKNETVDQTGALKRFSMQSDGTYKVTNTSSDDTILKIGKSYDGTKGKIPSNQALAKDGYDAVKLGNNHFRLLDAGNQVVDPERAFIAEEPFTAIKKEVQQTTKDDIDHQKIAKELETLGIGKRTALTVAGALAGEVYDNWTGSDSGAWVGGALGLALGMPSVRNKLSTIIKGSEDSFEATARTLDEAEKQIKKAQDLKQEGFKGDIRNEQEVNAWQKFKNSINQAKENGKSAWKDIFDNDFVTPMVRLFKNLGINEGNELFKKLYRTESAHNIFMGDFIDALDKRFKNMTLDQFKAKQADVLREYAQKAGLKGEFSDESLVNSFGESVFRIITHEGELDNAGKYVFNDESHAAKKAYENKDLLKRDEFILKHPEGQKIVETTREAFDGMGDRLINTYEEAIQKLRDGELSRTSGLVFKDFYNSGLSMKQYKDTLKAGEFKDLFDKAVKDDVFNEAVQFREKQLKIQNLKGRYVPQAVDPDRLAYRKNLWWKAHEGTEGYKTDADLEKGWAKHMQQRTIAHNTEGYQALDMSGTNVETKHYRKFKTAINDLKNTLVHRIQDDEVRKKLIKALDAEDPLITDKIIGKTKKGWYIKNPPEDIIGKDYNIIADINKDNLGQAQRQYINTVMVKQSNHLDNVRNYILPPEILESDINKLFDQYARDVGVKAHLIESELGTERQLQKKLDGIAKALKKKGIGDTEISQKMGRIRSWYAQMSHTSNSIEVGMSKAEIMARRETSKKNSKLYKILMNLSALRFMWFTPFYSWATPFIQHPYSTSFRNIASSYKDIFMNPEQLKSVEDHLYKTGALKKILSSVSTYSQTGEQTLGTVGGGDWLHWTNKLAERGINFSANFSPTKSALKRMGVDYRKGGLLRLFYGDIYDVSGAEASTVIMSTFKELQDMVEAGVKLLDNPELTEAVGGRKKFRIGDIRRKLENLGVEDPDSFIRKSNDVTNDVKSEVSNISGYYNKITGQDSYSIDGDLRGEYDRIIEHTLGGYFGRTKTTRPLKWLDNGLGRMLSQFSVYSQNFGVHTVEERIYRPLKDWADRYPIQNDTPLYKVMWDAKRGNDEALKKAFGDQWKQAVNDFPVDAVDNALKVTPVAMGVGGAMMASRDAVIDLIDMATNEAIGNDDYDSWKRTKRDYGDAGKYFDDDEIGWDTAKLFTNALGLATNLGFFQRIPQVLYQSRYQGGIAETNPVTSMLNDNFNYMGKWYNYNTDNIGEKAPRDFYDWFSGQVPILPTFSGVQDTIGDLIFNQPKNRGKSLPKKEMRL